MKAYTGRLYTQLLNMLDLVLLAWSETFGEVIPSVAGEKEIAC